MQKKKVILYIRKTNIIGGIETFIYNFCYYMSLYFDITVVCEVMADIQAERLKPFAEVKIGEASKEHIDCDTLLMLRIGDTIPSNINYKKVIRRIHTMKSPGVQDIPRDGDVTVAISEAVKEDFDIKGPVINNLMRKSSKLFLISDKVPAPDKG